MSGIRKIIALVGPTASGKTALAIALAKRAGGEIISADSRQIYRGMDIGTAKPTAAERRVVPHHLMDICDPDDDYTVADYKRDAVKAINGVAARGKLPILVGGTGLYVRAVVQNLDIPKVKADPRLRRKIEDEVREKGLSAAFERLILLDPDASSAVDPKNPRRVIRALEVTLATGRPFTALRRSGAPLFDATIIGLSPDPAELRMRIDRRTDGMMRRGLVAETERLIRRYGADCRALDAIGYREIAERMPLVAARSPKGRAARREAAAAIKLDSWHYAKRQITWFKKEPGVRWYKDRTDALSALSALADAPLTLASPILGRGSS